MSWSFSVPSTPRDKFAEAVDAATATGQPANTPGLADDVAAAKSATKALGDRTKRANISATVGGHCLVPNEGKNVHDGISIQVNGAD